MSVKNFGWAWNEDMEDDKYTHGKTLQQRAIDYLLNFNLDTPPIDKTLLVVGCGAFKEILFLNRFFKHITVIDIDTRKAKRSCKGIKNVTIIETDILDFKTKKKFDFIYCVGVLHHTLEPRKYFNALPPLMKRDGRLFIWLYNKQRFALLRLLRPYRWSGDTIQLFSIGVGIVSYPIYKLIKQNDKPLRSWITNIYDGICCEYQWVTKEKEVISWFNDNGFLCLNKGEGYLGSRWKKT